MDDEIEVEVDQFGNVIPIIEDYDHGFDMTDDE